jgi:hypothetical protein
MPRPTIPPPGRRILLPGGGWALPFLACLVAAPLLGACSARQKKLSSGGGPMEAFFYDLLGAERAPAYYYELVRRSRDPETFRYRLGDDPYLLDKNVDAIQRLGDARFARLEGEVLVVLLLCDILASDPSALAQAAAAVSLTKIGLRHPPYDPPSRPDPGGRWEAALAELDALHPGDRRDPDGPEARARARALIEELGALERVSVQKVEALRHLPRRRYLVDEADPALRAAIDTTLVRRSADAIRDALEAGAEAPVDFVRADAIRGLKLLGVEGALDVIVGRLAYEPSPRVRGEAAEYLGRIGGREAVAALLVLLGDAEGSVRWKARRALARVGGQDLGARPGPWLRWARTRWPGLEGPAGVDAGPADG